MMKFFCKITINWVFDHPKRAIQELYKQAMDKNTSLEFFSICKQEYGNGAIWLNIKCGALITGANSFTLRLKFDYESNGES